MKEQWIDINLVNSSDLGNIVSCDTRDFAVITHDDSFDMDNIVYDETSVFEQDEILPFLQSIKYKLIVNDCYYHRMNVIRYNIPEDSNHYKGWIKYIRFVKHNGKYVMYTTGADDIHVLSKTIVNANNIIIRN